MIFRRKVVRQIGIVSLIFPLLSVSLVLLPAGSANAVSSGSAVTTAPPWVALVTQNTTILGHNVAVTSECTGTLIAVDWVVTAAHCLYDEKTDKVVPQSKIRVVLKRNEISPDDGSGRQYSITDEVINPGFTMSPEQDDIALLQLKESGKFPLPSGAAPMPLAPASLSVGAGTSVTAYGYGLVNQAINTTTGAPIYYKSTYANYLGETQPGSYLTSPGCNAGDFTCFSYVGPSEITHGDSGGPWVIDPSNPALLAVTDQYAGDIVVTGNNQGYFTKFLSTDVTNSSIHSWIDSTAGIAMPTPNTIVRTSSGSSWLIGEDGLRHSIPDSSTYSCIRRLGDAVETLPAYSADEIPLSDAAASCGSNVAGAAVIFSGNVGLGINSPGDLNVPNEPPSAGTGTTNYGLRYLPDNDEFAGPGCPCEGWGVADESTGADGYADESTGSSGLNVKKFSYTPDSAISEVAIGSTFDVTNDYTPVAGTPDLFQDAVTIKNISGVRLANVLYRRLVDWDMEPTAFDEYVTIQGMGNSPYLAATTNDGFDSADPLSASDNLGATGNFTMNGPEDQGAQFDFDFGEFGVGRSVHFTEYYGAAPDEAQAASDLMSVGVQAYSLGEPSLDLSGDPNTAMLGFAGISGSALTIPVSAGTNHAINAKREGMRSSVRPAGPNRSGG